LIIIKQGRNAHQNMQFVTSQIFQPNGYTVYLIRKNRTGISSASLTPHEREKPLCYLSVITGGVNVEIRHPRRTLIACYLAEV